MTLTRRQFSRGVLLIPMMLLVGCGGTPEPTPAADTTTPEEILASASARLADTSSVHFTLDVAGDTFVDSGRTIRLLGAEGDLARPDRVRTTFQAEVLGRAVSLQLITVGEESWTTNILTGEWGPAPPEFSYRPDVLFSTQDGIGPVMGRVEGVEREADVDVDGKAAYHLSASVDQSIVGPLTYYTITGSPVTVDLWIARDSNDLLRAMLTEPPREDGAEPAIWTLNLSHHDQPVEIEPPV